VLAAEVLNGIRSDNWPDPGRPPPSSAPPRAADRTAGPRPLHSVDRPASSGSGLRHGHGPDHGDGLGPRNEFG
jgi:hypothetical protein